MSKKHRSMRLVVGVVLALGALAAGSAEPARGQSRHLLRLADYYALTGPSDLQLSPDGATVAFTRAAVEREEDRRTRSVWAMAPDGSDVRVLVDEGASPLYSPDGRWLAFLRETQVWLLPLPGGEPWRLTGLAEGVDDFHWSPDGSRLVLVAREAPEPPGSVLPEEELIALAAEQQASAPVIEEPAPLDAGAWEPDAPTEPEPAAIDDEVETEPVDPGPYPAGELVPPAPEEAEPVRPLPTVITRLQFKQDGVGYVGSRPRHLFVAEVPATGAQAPVPVRRLTGGRFSDGSPRWSPDGRWVAFASNRSAEPDTNNNSDVWVVAPDGGPARRVTSDPGNDGTPRWSPDSTHLAYRHVPAEPPVYANPRLRMVAVGAPAGATVAAELEIGEPVELTAALDRPLVSAAQWSGDGAAIYVTLQDRGTVTLASVTTGLGASDRRRPAPAAGETGAVIGGPRVVDDFLVLPGGRELLAVLAEYDAPPEIYRAPVAPQAGAVPSQDPVAHVQPRPWPPPAELVALTDFNREWSEDIAFSAAEPLRFNSTDETVIEGWLLRPPGYREGLRYPLIVRIHGGPVSQFDWGFSFERQWLAAQGYAVLYLNPRGSSGYGEDFAHALWADWGGPDLDDVLAGIDHLVARGIVDPGRVGVGGWSYGGILTNYLVTRTDRFAAAISGASEADYFACYGTDDLQRWWEDELGLPYEPEARARYEALSPIHDVADIVTPTLFMVGENDWRVPASQSEQIYTQLRRRMVDGGPLTGLIVYPDESHGISRPSFVIDRWRRYRAWYDLHLKNDAAADPFFGLRAW